MVTVMRSAVIAPGKTGEALSFAHQMAKHVKEKYGITIDLLMPVGGNPGRIAWRANYEGLAQWEALTTKLMADAEYLMAVASNSSTFLPGSVIDDIWRTI